MMVMTKIISMALALILLAGLMPAAAGVPATSSGLDLVTVYIDDSGSVHIPPVYIEPSEGGGFAGIMPASTQNYAEGSTRNFFFTRVAEGSAQAGTLVRQSNHVNIWVLNGHTAPAADELNTMITAFDGIFERMTEDFGAFKGVRISLPFSNVPCIGDVNNDGRINVLLYGMGGGGFFTNGDFFTEFGNIPIALFHMNFSSSTMNNPLNFYNTFAHELHHLLFFMYFDVYAPEPYEYLWLNEALGELAGQFYAQPGTESILASRMIDAAGNSYAHSGYGDFLNFNNSLKNYGMGALHSALMHRKTGGEYVKDIFRYFRELLPPAAQFNANRTMISNASAAQIVGDAFNYAGLTGEAGAAAFDLMYFLFMEKFAADREKFYSEQFSAFNLWGIRPALGTAPDTTIYPHAVFRDGGSSFTSLSSRTSLPVLPSGNTVTLGGYGSPAAPLGASHEMLYRLSGESAGSPVIRISIADNNDRTQYYVVVPREGPDTVLNRQRGRLGADIYPLRGNINFADTEGRPAYLFAVTLFRDVSGVSVTYSWQDKMPLFGDVDGDGNINAADVTLLRRYVAAEDKVTFKTNNFSFNEDNARLTGSYIITAADITLLRRWIASNEKFPLGSGT
jgi:hypothetical protein